MNTGFKELDKLLNIEEPQLIILTGDTPLIDILSGDIANDVCLKQEKEVLEIVSHRKEYLIKRLAVNVANVNYQKWTIKTEYTDTELKQIGQSMVNLIETTDRLPTIIEQEMGLYDLKNVVKYVDRWANHYADRLPKVVDSLIVLDIGPFNQLIFNIEQEKRERSERIRFLKRLRKICKKLTCTILLVYPNYSPNKKIREEIKKEIENNSDTYITVTIDKTEKSINHLTVARKNNILGNFKLKFDYVHRRFIDYEGGKIDNE